MTDLTKSMLDAAERKKTGRDSSYILQDKYVKVLAEGRTGPFNPTELDILSRVVHPGVIPCDLISSSTSDVRGMSFSTRICEDTLTSWLTKRRPLTAKIEVCTKLLKTVEFLHSSGIVHLDVKPDNIMIDSCNDVFLIDYGSARYTECFPPTVLLSSNWAKTTQEYRAPEILFSKDDVIRTGSTADVWSLALVLLTIISGGYRVYPEDALCSRDKLEKYIQQTFRKEKTKLVNYLLKIGKCQDPTVESLLSSMFSYSPERRPTVTQILNCPIWKHSEGNEGYVIPPILKRKEVSREAIVSIIKCFSTELREASIQSIFHAIDLVYRIGEERPVVLAACCWIALKSCFGHKSKDFSKILEYFETPNGTEILQEEERVIIALEGVLIDTLYSKCRNRDNLLHVLTEVVYDYEDYISYSSRGPNDVLFGEQSKLCQVKDIL